MRRIKNKNVEEEIQKVSSYPKDTQYYLDVIYDQSRSEQDFLLQEMEYFGINDSDIKRNGHFDFPVQKKLRNEIVSKTMLYRILIALLLALKEKSLNDYSPCSRHSDKYSLVEQFLNHTHLWFIKSISGDLDALSTSLSHRYKEDEYGYGVVDTNIHQWLKKSVKYCKEKLKKLSRRNHKQ